MSKWVRHLTDSRYWYQYWCIPVYFYFIDMSQKFWSCYIVYAYHSWFQDISYKQNTIHPVTINTPGQLAGGYVWYWLLLRMLGILTAASVVIPLGLLKVRDFQKWANRLYLNPKHCNRDTHVFASVRVGDMKTEYNHENKEHGLLFIYVYVYISCSCCIMLSYLGYNKGLCYSSLVDYKYTNI